MRNKLLILMIISVFSCERKNSILLKDFYSTEEVILENKNDDGGWNCFESTNKEFCLPKDWLRVDQSNFELFYYLEGEDKKNSFYVFIDYDLNEIGITPKEYCLEVYRQLLDDQNEEFLRYSFTELILENKKVYYGEFITKIQNAEYLTYSLYIPYQGRFFDITQKTLLSNRSEAYALFQTVLFNVKVDGKPLLNFSKEVGEVNKIDFEEWKKGITTS